MADPIRQPNTSTPAAFMQRALDLAAEAEKSGRGNAYGAVIVQEDKIIGQGTNAIYAQNDPTAHGEVEAIKDACRRTGSNDLSGAVIYTSGGSPCPMCETAAYWGNIERVYTGRSISDRGKPGYGC